MEALDIPLKALPGMPPLLEEGWGFVSLSHCRDAFLVGWSEFPIGIDLERLDRSFNARKLSQRFFHEANLAPLIDLEGEELRLAVLEQWSIRESSIKWQQGSISKDLQYWYWDQDLSLAIHAALGHKLNTYRVHYEKWLIVVAWDYLENIEPQFVCVGDKY